MTILFAGGEDSSFATVGGFHCVATTNADFVRPSFARAAMADGTTDYSGITDPPPNRITTPAFTPTSSLWVHGVFSNTNSISTPTINTSCMRVLDASGVARILVRHANSTDNTYKISTRNAAGTFTDLVTATATSSSFFNTPTPIDLFVNYSTSGQVSLYIGGELIVDTGPGVNVTTDSATTLAQADFAHFDAISEEGDLCYWSEVIIATISTLGMGLLTLPPVAAGNTQSWTGVVADIDEVPINDANTITTTSDNELSEWTVSTTLPTGAWVIVAIVQEARVSVGTGGPQHFEWLVRTADGTDHVTGSVAPTGALVNYSNIWPTNPQTDVAWVAGDLINAGIESLA